MTFEEYQQELKRQKLRAMNPGITDDQLRRAELTPQQFQEEVISGLPKNMASRNIGIGVGQTLKEAGATLMTPQRLALRAVVGGEKGAEYERKIGDAVTGFTRAVVPYSMGGSGEGIVPAVERKISAGEMPMAGAAVNAVRAAGGSPADAAVMQPITQTDPTADLDMTPETQRAIQQAEQRGQPATQGQAGVQYNNAIEAAKQRRQEFLERGRQGATMFGIRTTGGFGGGGGTGEPVADIATYDERIRGLGQRAAFERGTDRRAAVQGEMGERKAERRQQERMEMLGAQREQEAAGKASEFNEFVNKEQAKATIKMGADAFSKAQGAQEQSMAIGRVVANMLGGNRRALRKFEKTAGISDLPQEQKSAAVNQMIADMLGAGMGYEEILGRWGLA